MSVRSSSERAVAGWSRLKTAAIRTYVSAHLKKRWSPEQIAGRLRKEKIGLISPEAIYQFIYAHKGEDLRIYLRRRRKIRTPHGSRRYQRLEKPRGRSIEERPRIVNARRRLGDWEGDTVESRDHKPGINTLVERKSGLVLITKLSGKRSADTVSVLAARFKDIPASLRHTITLDNGPENSDWQGIESATGMQSYFAHPYCSGERGTNENTNGLIRDFYPKKTDFTLVSAAEVSRMEYALNTRPRKRLGWRTPLEVWGGALRG